MARKIFVPKNDAEAISPSSEDGEETISRTGELLEQTGKLIAPHNEGNIV